MTKRAHLEQIGKTAPEPEIPAEAEHVWAWFWEVDRGRGSNGYNLNPITFREIDAWARLVGAEPLAWEVRALGEMDRIYLAEVSKKMEAARKTK